MTLGEAFLYYVLRFVVFGVVAGAGIAAVIKIRKSKN